MAIPLPDWFGAPRSPRRLRVTGLLALPATLTGGILAVGVGVPLIFGVLVGLVYGLVMCGMCFAIARKLSSKPAP